MPVDAHVLAAFAAASFVLLIIPGPTIILVISQALAHGRQVALASVAGVGLGDLFAATLSLIGVGTVLAASATAFTVIKWIGAAYLVWIGVKIWRSPVQSQGHRVLSGLRAAVHHPSQGLRAASCRSRRHLRNSRHDQCRRICLAGQFGAQLDPAPIRPANGHPHRQPVSHLGGNCFCFRASSSLNPYSTLA
jgi:hypothetical protein